MSRVIEWQRSVALVQNRFERTVVGMISTT